MSTRNADLALSPPSAAASPPPPPPSPPPTLNTIPSEVLSIIALHLISDSLAPPIALLQTCRSIHEALIPANNHRLYARLYRSYFDVGAATRRSASASAAVDGPGTGTRTRIGSRKGAKARAVEAIGLTKELERRMRALRRLEGMVMRNDVRVLDEEDVWVVYVMLVENDGRNLRRLKFLPDFLHLYHTQHLLPQCFDPGFPSETILTSLMMWIAWIYSHHPHTVPPENSCGHSIEDRAEERYTLRPYVFAAHRFSMYFAPWTASTVPMRASDVDDEAPYIADLRPVDRGVEMEWYGRKIRVSPPILAHAAVLRFFDTRGDDDDLDEVDEEMLSMGVGNGLLRGDAMDGESPLSTSENGEEDDDGNDDDNAHFPLGARRPHALLSSRSHDRDWNRLISCANPRSSLGMPRSSWKGTFGGAWEGNFSFFDFEPYGEMLAGQARAMYSGPYGVQRQVWKVRETYVRRKRAAGEGFSKVGGRARNEGKSKGKAKSKAKALEDDVEMVQDAEAPSGPEPSSNGAAAQLLDSVEPDAEVDGSESSRRFPLRGPSTNANFPTGPSTLTGGLASARAEELSLQATIKQQVEAMEGYEAVPDEELDELLNDEEQMEELGVEMLLTGTGHSAWGRFLLKGRVRSWDGLASLVKEYAPDSRGKWLYRGYVVAGDVLVGRWRDTFTADEYVGYEGTFILNRR